MEISQIHIDIIDFISKKLGKEINNNLLDISFFEKPILFSSKDMLYLFWYVESNWNINLTIDDIKNPLLFTLNGLESIIINKLNRNLLHLDNIKIVT